MLIILLLKRKSQGTSSCTDYSFQEECWNKTGADSNPGERGGPCRPGAVFICPRLHSTFMFFCLHPSSEPQISGLGNQTKWPMKHKTRSSYTQWSLSGFMSKRGWTTKHHLVLSKNHTEPPFFFYGFDLKTGFHAKLALVSEEFLGRVQARLQLVWTRRHWQLQSACVEAVSSHSALWTLPRFYAILITWSFRWLKIIRCIDKKYNRSVHLFVLSFYKNREENFWKAMDQKELGRSKDLSMYGGKEEIWRHS